ncbi:MAG: hypothetical protein QOI95_3277 [Acidimicrobiaceae bacterium]
MIGAQRSGTSSLYRWLGEHPDVAPSLRKETEYFSRRYDRGERWYRAHFPLRARQAMARRRGSSLMAFEATPDYLLHPLAPERAARLVPAARLVVLLRDPVARACSHWEHMTRLGFEHLSFEEALAREDERIAPDLARLRQDPLHDAPAFLRFSYRARGRYVEQLEQWLAWYPRDRLHVVRFDDLVERPRETFAALLQFAGLSPWEPLTFPNASGPRGASPPRDVELTSSERQLRDELLEANQGLDELVGLEMGWLA